MSLVRVARVGRPHGIRGEVYLDRTSLTASELEQVRTYTWRGERGDSKPVVVEAVRPADRRLLATLAGVKSREQAALLTRGDLWAEADRLPAPEPGEAYAFQLVGMSVVTEDGRTLGAVADIIETGAHPVYVVRGEREMMLPAIAPFVQNVDFESGRITVRLIPGLEDL